MATPKGNYLAFQPLQPEKYTQGDLYMGVVGQLIADKKAAEAAKLKKDQEEGKALIDFGKDIKPEYINTISPIQDSLNKMTSSTMEQLAYARSIAYDSSIPLAERQKAMVTANRMWSEQKAMGTFMSSKEDLEAYNKLVAQVDSGNYYKGDKRRTLIENIRKGTFQLGHDKDGNAVAIIVENPYANSENGESKGNSVSVKMSEIKNLMTTQMESDLLSGDKGFDKYLMSNAPTKQVKTSNGNYSLDTTSFDRDTAKKMLYQQLGLDAEKDFDSQIDLGTIPREYQQLYFRAKGKEISSPSEMKSAIDIALDVMANGVDKKSIQNKKDSALDEQVKRTKIAAMQKSMQEKTEQMTAPVVENSNIKLYNPDGTYKGYTTMPTASINIPGTTNFLSAQPVVSKDGTTYNKYYVGAFAKDGNIVYNEVQNPKTILSSSKVKDPIAVMASVNNAASKLKPVPYGKRGAIYTPIANNKSQQYGDTSINIKAKENPFNWKKGFENGIYQNIMDNTSEITTQPLE